MTVLPFHGDCFLTDEMREISNEGQSIFYSQVSEGRNIFLTGYRGRFIVEYVNWVDRWVHIVAGVFDHTNALGVCASLDTLLSD